MKKIIYVCALVCLVLPVFAFAADPVSPTGGGWNIDSVTGFGLPGEGVTIFGIISNILSWLLAALGIVGVIGFVISGILYLVSTGETTTMERAKNAMKYSIIGIIVGLCGLVVIQAVEALLDGVEF